MEAGRPGSFGAWPAEHEKAAAHGTLRLVCGADAGRM